ncbi:retrotransposon protein, putative, ty1-copia subclass [Tanacetum coccineum]
MQLTLVAYLVPYLFTRWSDLRIVLSVEDKLDYLDQPIPPALVPAQAGQQVAPKALAAHAAWVKGSKEIARTYVYEMEADINEIWEPFRLVIVLNNCHYAPSITEDHLVSRLYDDGYVNHFVDNAISVSMNNLVYFSVVLRDGIFEIDLSNSNTNDSSMYVVSNKRSKLNLDSALLWHCRLGHISKKRTKKFQHDGLLNSTDLRAFEKCVSCMSKKMEKKPYTHQVERVKDLLGLIHTDDYALETDARILHMVPTTKFEKTPYEVWHRQALKLSYLKVWGCEALVKRDTLTKPDKLEPRSIKCIFVGYPKETMGYSFYYPPENKVLVAQNAEFLENSLITQKASGSLEDLEIFQEEDTHPSINTSLNHEEGDLGEPANYKAALLDPESDKWLNAMNVEMQSMKDNEVWDLVDLPPNGKTIGSKWLFKKKTDMDRVVYTFKARLVAKGFTQTYVVDYEETFSPVADIRAIRILIDISAYYDYEIWQMEVKTAFLNGHLSEEVYMKQPEGFVNPKYPNRVCKLKLSIYRLKQASRCFAMKDLGEAAYILGIKIYRDRSRRLIGLYQSAYIEKLLKNFHMENSKRRSFPMQEKLRLSKSQGASTPAKLKRIQNVPYASAVGSIMYDVRCTRPDVAFAQNITSRFQKNPGDLHWTTVKNILKYLRNTKDMFLVYEDDLKSQTGYVFILNGGAVDCKSTKQSIFATSSAEAEYIAAYDASKESV